MKKFLIAITLLSVLTVISTGAYIYLSTKNAVDTVIASARPFLDIKYQRFSNFMDGSIAIHNVTVYSGTENIDIDSVELHLDSALDFINFEKKIKSGELLPKLNLKINHIYSKLPQRNPSSKKLPLELIDSYISALGCGDIKELTIDQLGYSGLDTSVNLDFNYNKTSHEAVIEANITLNGMSDVSFKTTLPNITSYFDFANIENKMSHLNITLQDLGYNNRLIEFCSEKAKLESPQYVDNHIKLLKSYLVKSNINISDDLYNAYRSYYADSSPITFTIAPNNPINLEYIALYDLKDWPAILGLSIYNNGNKLNNINFSWKEGSLVKNLLNARSLPKKVEAIQVKTTKKAEDKKQAKKKETTPREFVEIPINQLGQYISSTVKLESKLGRIYTGTVKYVSSTQVSVEIRMQGGTADVPVSTFQIEKAFIYK